MMIRSFTTVLLPLVAMCFLVFLGIFETVPTDLGSLFYAEVPNMTFILPKWLKMPFNTAINFAYVIVGSMWLANTTNNLEIHKHTEIQAFLFYVFNWMVIFYGPVQCVRIIVQGHGFAVLDQWCTLPFFMWVFVWGHTIVHNWNVKKALINMIASIASYSLCIVLVFGFEIVLGFHIVCALIGAYQAYTKYPSTSSRLCFKKALFSCFGFIVLKLMDLKLKQLHILFQYLSGHFLSKVCDVMQIHYVNSFFMHIVYTMNKDSKKKLK